MPDFILLAAAAVVFVTLLVHVFVGGAWVARPLLADTALPPVAKWLSYYAWHLVSLMLAALSAFVAWCGFTFPPRSLTAGLTLFFVAASCLSYVIAARGKIHPLRFPSTSLFLLCAVLTLVDILLSAPDMD